MRDLFANLTWPTWRHRPHPAFHAYAPKTESARRTEELLPETVRVLRELEPLHVAPEPDETVARARVVENPGGLRGRQSVAVLQEVGWKHDRPVDVSPTPKLSAVLPFTSAAPCPSPLADGVEIGSLRT